MHEYAQSNIVKLWKKKQKKNETYYILLKFGLFVIYLYSNTRSSYQGGMAQSGSLIFFFIMYTFFLYIIYLGLNKYYVLRVTGPNLQKCPIQPFSDICLFLSECDFHIIFIKNLFLLRILYLYWCSRAEKKYDLKQILNSNLFHKCYPKPTYFFFLGLIY